MASNLVAMAFNLVAPNLLEMASNLVAMAFNLVAPNLLEMASNLVAMASKIPIHSSLYVVNVLRADILGFCGLRPIS